METIRLEKSVPVIAHYDVVVCGGGPAGWVAAVSAARAGRKTALIERYSFLGGTAAAGFVVPISGFFFKSRRVVGGIAWEFVQRLEALGAAQVEMPAGHVSVNLEYYKLVAGQMVGEAGVELYTNCVVSDCIMEGGGRRLSHVVFQSKNGAEAIAADCFIDATGDGDLCHMAGVPMLPAAESLQPVSLCFVLSGVDTSTALLRDCIRHDGRDGRRSLNTVIRQMLLDTAEAHGIGQFGGPWFQTLLTGDCVAVNMTRIEANAADRASMTRAESALRQDMFRLVDCLRETYAEFRGCGIAASGVNAGVRETRHIRGVQTLTLRDVAEGTVFACPVAHCAHPMDIHASKGAGQQLIRLEGDCFVPHGAMVAAGFENLIAAGRCISAEKEPYASLRVQATVMSIGEAAGVMADLCCGGECADRLPEDALAKAIAARGFVR